MRVNLNLGVNKAQNLSQRQNQNVSFKAWKCEQKMVIRESDEVDEDAFEKKFGTEFYPVFSCWRGIPYKQYETWEDVGEPYWKDAYGVEKL